MADGDAAADGDADVRHLTFSSSCTVLVTSTTTHACSEHTRWPMNRSRDGTRDRDRDREGDEVGSVARNWICIVCLSFMCMQISRWNIFARCMGI